MNRQQSLQFANPNLPLWREAFAGADWMRLHFSPVYTGVGVRRGNGEPVVLVPGFAASDNSLLELKVWLERMGYRAYYSGLGRNVGCPSDLTSALCETVERAHAETGQKVTLIGHSLGGCIARATAIRCPEHIARVVTLGSPVRGVAVHPLVLAAGDFLGHGECDESCYLPMQVDLPRGIEETCMYTKTDGVVDWRTCATTRSRKVEVSGTHVGLVWNPEVYREIGRILAASCQETSPRALSTRRQDDRGNRRRHVRAPLPMAA